MAYGHFSLQEILEHFGHGLAVQSSSKGQNFTIHYT